MPQRCYFFKGRVIIHKQYCFWCPLISSEARWCTAASPVPTPQSWFSSPPLRRPSPPEIIGKSDHSMKHSVGSWWFLMINDCLWLFNQHHYFFVSQLGFWSADHHLLCLFVWVLSCPFDSNTSGTTWNKPQKSKPPTQVTRQLTCSLVVVYYNLYSLIY